MGEAATIGLTIIFLKVGGFSCLKLWTLVYKKLETKILNFLLKSNLNVN